MPYVDPANRAALRTRRRTVPEESPYGSPQPPTTRQAEIKTFIELYWMENGKPPSLNTIAAAAAAQVRSKTTIRDMLAGLHRRGHVLLRANLPERGLSSVVRVFNATLWPSFSLKVTYHAPVNPQASHVAEGQVQAPNHATAVHWLMSDVTGFCDWERYYDIDKQASEKCAYDAAKLSIPEADTAADYALPATAAPRGPVGFPASAADLAGPEQRVLAALRNVPNHELPRQVLDGYAGVEGTVDALLAAVDRETGNKALLNASLGMVRFASPRAEELAAACVRPTSAEIHRALLDALTPEVTTALDLLYGATPAIDMAGRLRQHGMRLVDLVRTIRRGGPAWSFDPRFDEPDAARTAVDFLRWWGIVSPTDPKGGEWHQVASTDLGALL